MASRVSKPGEIRLGDIRKTTFGNGLTVVTREMHHAPVASAWIWYRVGGRNETLGSTGISHWVEHMLFKGTPTYPQGEFDKAISREGGTFNGMTWIDWTTYFETLPSDRIDLALRVEADRMVNAVFDPDELNLERTVIISERQGNENNPGFMLGEALIASAFQAHPYHHPVIGWMSDLETMTRDQLYQHYRTYYTPNNAVLAVAGDFDYARMLARIEELFGSIPPGPPVPKVTAKEPAQRGERRVTVEGPGTTSYIEIAYKAPRTADPDFFPMMVLDAVLSGAKGMSLSGGGVANRSSRLYKALVETELAVEADSEMTTTVDPFLISISATARAGHPLDELEDAIDKQIRRLLDEPVGQDELDKALKQTRAQFSYSSETATDQGNWLGFSEIVADVDWFEHFLERLSAVTVDDVRRVAQSYLRPSQRNVGRYIPSGEKSAEAEGDAGDGTGDGEHE